MKKFLSALVITSTLLTSAVSSPKAQAAEVVAITAVGVLGTVIVFGLGYAGYGSGILTIELAGNRAFKMENYRPALDVVASGDESLITPDIRDFLTEIRLDQPALKDVSDLVILESIVDAINLAI